MAENEKPKEGEDTQLATWYKKIEIIGIDIKSLHRENETRLETPIALADAIGLH
jgi:hypothetical protein